MQDLVYGPYVVTTCRTPGNRIRHLLTILTTAAAMSFLAAAILCGMGIAGSLRTRHISCDFGYAIVSLFLCSTSLGVRNWIIRSRRGKPEV
jgi:hypothetical protein